MRHGIAESPDTLLRRNEAEPSHRAKAYQGLEASVSSAGGGRKMIIFISYLSTSSFVEKLIIFSHFKSLYLFLFLLLGEEISEKRERLGEKEKIAVDMLEWKRGLNMLF